MTRNCQYRIALVALVLPALLAVCAGCRAPRFAGLEPAPPASSLEQRAAAEPAKAMPPVAAADSAPVVHMAAYVQTAPEPPPVPGEPRGAERRERGPGREEVPVPPPVPDDAVTLDEVRRSVYYAFPGLEIARRELEIAFGRELQAWGEFDLKLKAESLSQPLGFYENYRNAVKVEQALYQGANVFGQYRIGDGNFPTWYGERETDEGGELKIGLLAPLLRGRAIDGRRSDILQATLRRRQVDPQVASQLLEFTYLASDAYWSWVAAGMSYRVQRELLRVTQERNRIYEARVEQQDLARLELVQNERLIAAREAKLIETQRKLQQSAIKLSLYLRDEAGRPYAPPPDRLPSGFPDPQQPDIEHLSEGLQRALASRPELRELDLERQQAAVDLALGRNQTLPALNAVVEASQDVGGKTSSKGDKSPFELEAGLQFDLPVQRRKAEGKIREAEGKLAQIAAKRRYTANKIELQVQDAISALATSFERIERAQENLRLARELEEAERERFDAGDSDLLRVAIQETAAIEAALQQIEAVSDYFKALAAYHWAIALMPEDTEFDADAE